MDLRRETFQSPRGEFVVLTGRGRIRSAKSCGSRSRGVDLELVPDGTPEGERGIQVIVEDFTSPAFRDLFEGDLTAKCAAFLLRHRATTFSFRVEVIRKPGVDKATPIRSIPQKYLFRRLVVLDFADEEITA